MGKNQAVFDGNKVLAQAAAHPQKGMHNLKVRTRFMPQKIAQPPSPEKNNGPSLSYLGRYILVHIYVTF